MISFLKKLLFCVGFLVLFSEGVFVVTAQNNPSVDIPCSGPNSGSCSVGGKQGVCRDFSCDISGESQSTIPIPASAPSSTLGGDAPRPAASSATKTDSKSDSCGILNPVGCVKEVLYWLARFVLINVPLFIFYLCSLFLDFSISFGLETMKTLVNEDIYSLWLFTRNLVLAAALFSFLYFVGMVIVGLGHSIKKAAVSVILFALFSGFSFSVSTYLIDASNLVTISLYSSVDPNWANHSLSEPVIGTKFIKYLGYAGLADALGKPEGASILGQIATTDIFQMIGLNIIVGLTLIYNAYVLLMMSLLFIVRDLGLIVGVVFSPLLLVDQAVPKLSDLAKKFRAFFTGQLLIGPVFMFLMYIGLKICDIAVKGINTKLPGQVGVPVGSPGVILFQVLMITGVFWYTYKTCKSLSGVLGEATLGAIGGLAQKAMIATPLGAVGQAASFVGKNTVGRAARHLSREDGMLYKNQESFFGKKAFNAMNYAGNKATYDFNNSKFFAGAAQKAGMSSSIGGGFAGKTVSYADARQAAIAQAEKYAKDTKDPEVRAKLVENSLNKFKRGNVGTVSVNIPGTSARLGSDTDAKDFEKMRAQVRKSSTSTQRTSLTDQTNDINFEDLHSGDDTKRQAIIAKLKELQEKAGKGGEEVKKWYGKYLQNKILTETVNAIKDDDTLDPTSMNFDRASLDKYKGSLDEMLIAGLGLDKMEGGVNGTVAKKISESITKRLKEEIERIALEKKKRITEQIKVEERYQEAATRTLSTNTPTRTTSTKQYDSSDDAPSFLDLVAEDDLMSTVSNNASQPGDSAAPPPSTTVAPKAPNGVSPAGATATPQPMAA